MTTQFFWRLKPCSRCRERKPPDAFPPNAQLSSGLSSWCRACHAEATRAWRDANPEQVAARNAARRLPPLLPRACATCGETFTPRRRDGRYCSSACRARRLRR
jgi:hypothetical protein